jgi:hypothetical protein
MLCSVCSAELVDAGPADPADPPHSAVPATATQLADPVFPTWTEPMLPPVEFAELDVPVPGPVVPPHSAVPTAAMQLDVTVFPPCTVPTLPVLELDVIVVGDVVVGSLELHVTSPARLTQFDEPVFPSWTEPRLELVEFDELGEAPVDVDVPHSAVPATAMQLDATVLPACSTPAD